MKTSAIRFQILTLKHYLHKKLLEGLASPNAALYLKIIGSCAVFVLAVLLWQILSFLWLVLSYHRDPVSYLQDYYDPLTPRYIDTRAFRTSEDNVLDLDGYKEELFKLNEFNTYLSDKLPVNRKHKDPRSESCRIAARRLPSESELSPTSIIIVMYNEELSTLLRTVVSIVLNTPMNSVKEIIIVDDKSSRDELGSRLDRELAQFPFVKLIRNTKREGLIRSRIIGSKSAEGKIIIFLDSHVEVLTGWYTTMVARIMGDRKTVVCSVIAAIDHTTLALIPDKYTNIWGAWDWDMTFKWRPIPARELQRRGFDDSAPIRSPAMAGGIFAIDKDYFFELGAYDPGMKVWGGENLEMSFRIWMCGGALEINTCSYVAHIFRRSGLILKTVTGETALQQNTKRVVEVWLDDYKDAYYSAVPGNKNVEAGDFVSRVLLRQRLKCRSFAWYLREVFPDQLRPDRDFVQYGEVKGPNDVCLDTLGPGTGHQIGVFSCHGKGQNQFWTLLLSGEIINDNLCLDGDGENPRNVVLYDCHGLKGNQQWFITEDDVIKHGGSGKCLTHDGRYLLLLPCDLTDDRFVWRFAATTKEVEKKFYVLYAKQFGYVTKEEQAAKTEERRKRNKEQEKNKAKEAEERKKKEAEEEAAKKQAEEKKREYEDVEKKKADEQADKRSKEEEDFRKWRAEKKQQEDAIRHKEALAEKEKETFEEQKRKDREEEERRKSEEDKKRQKEEEDRKKFEEDKKRREEEEDRKKFEEDKKRREEEEDRKKFEEDKKRREEEEERKKFEEDKKRSEEEEERKKFEEEKRSEEKKMEAAAEEKRSAEEKRQEEENKKRLEEGLVEEERSGDKEKKVDSEKVKIGYENEKEAVDEDSVHKDETVKKESDETVKDIRKDADSNSGENEPDKEVDLKEFLAWKAAQNKKIDS